MTPIIDMDRFRKVTGAPGPAAAPDPYAGKTFAQLLTDDIPARIRSAKAKAMGMDLDGARADLRWVDEFRDRFETQITSIAGFQGTNPVGRAVATQALGLLQNQHMAELEPLLMSQELQDGSTRRSMLKAGYDARTADYAVRARNGDAEAALAVSAFMGPGAEASAVAAARTRTRGESGAEAVTEAGVRPSRNGIKYYDVAKSALTQGLDPAAMSTLGVGGVVAVARATFDAGDDFSEAALARVVNRAATDASVKPGAEQASVLTSTADAVSALAKVYGSDPVRARTAAAVVERLQEALPGAGLARSRQAALQATKTAATAADTARNVHGVFDFDVGHEAALAKTLLLRQLDPEKVANDPELSRISRVYTQAQAAGQAVITTKSFETNQDEAGTGFDALVYMVREAAQGAMFESLARGRDYAESARAQARRLSQGLMSLGLEDADRAQALGAVIADALASGKGFDASKLPELMGASPGIRDFVGTRIQKAVSDFATLDGDYGPLAVAGIPDPVSRARNRAKARALEVARAGGAAVSDADLETAVDTSPEVELTRRLMAVSGARVDNLRPGFGDRNAAVDAFTDTVAKNASRISGETSPMMARLFSATKIQDLGSKSVRDAAVKDVIDSFTGAFGAVAELTDPALVRKYAETRVDQVLKNMREAAEAEQRPGQTTFEAASGTDRDTVRTKFARGYRGTVASASPVAMYMPQVETELRYGDRDLAAGLAAAFEAGVGTPRDTRGFARTIQERLLTRAAFAPAPAPAAAAAESAQGSGFDAVRPSAVAAAAGRPASEAVTLAYSGALELHEKLTRPISDSGKRRFVASEADGMFKDVPDHIRVLAMSRIRKLAYDNTKSVDDMIATGSVIVQAYLDQKSKAELDRKRLEQQQRLELASAAQGFGGAVDETAAGTK